MGGEVTSGRGGYKWRVINGRGGYNDASFKCKGGKKNRSKAFFLGGGQRGMRCCMKKLQTKKKSLASKRTFCGGCDRQQW